MMYATYTKVSRSMLSAEEFLKPYLDSVLTPQKRKGYKFLRVRLRSSGQNGDDFARNLVTFIMEYEMYKKPRIIKW